MKVSLANLEDKVAAGIARLGYEGDDARIIKEVLLYAEMRGNNQSITKIATGGCGRPGTQACYQEQMRSTDLRRPGNGLHTKSS